MRKLNVEEIVESYAPAYPYDDWNEVLTSFLEDPVERRTVNLLQGELEREGGFRHPIVVSSETQVVLDGTHRVVASLLSSEKVLLEVIEVSDLEAARESATHSVEKVANTKIEGDCLRELSRVEEETLLDSLRSLKVSDELWVTAGVVFGTPTSGSFEVCWEDNISKEDTTLISEQVRSLIADNYSLEVMVKTFNLLE